MPKTPQSGAVLTHPCPLLPPPNGGWLVQTGNGEGTRMLSWKPTSLFHFPALPGAALAACLSSRAVLNQREMLRAGGHPTRDPAAPLLA